MNIDPKKLKYVTDLAEQLKYASIRTVMGGRGAWKPFNIDDFSPEYRDLIMQYLTDDITGIEAMLLAAEDFDRRETT